MRSGAKQWYARAMEGRPITPPPPFAWAIANLPKDYAETGDSYDWTPTEVLHKDYLAKWWKFQPKGQEKPLGISDFGIVLRLAYPNCDACRRRMGGKIRGGVAGLKGPESLRTPDEQYAYRRRRSYRNGNRIKAQ